MPNRNTGILGPRKRDWSALRQGICDHCPCPATRVLMAPRRYFCERHWGKRLDRGTHSGVHRS